MLCNAYLHFVYLWSLQPHAEGDGPFRPVLAFCHLLNIFLFVICCYFDADCIDVYWNKCLESWIFKYLVMRAKFGSEFCRKVSGRSTSRITRDWLKACSQILALCRAGCARYSRFQQIGWFFFVLFCFVFVFFFLGKSEKRIYLLYFWG